MTHTILTVEGMSCQHCVNAVTAALKELRGVGTVAIDLAQKTVAVDHDPAQATVEQMKAQIEDQGYEVVG